MKTSQFPQLAKNFPFLLYYRGNYKIDLSAAIFEIVESNLSLHFQRSFVTRLSYLVIECIQNVFRYSESQGTHNDYCLVYSDLNYCHIVTRNIVSQDKVVNLELRLKDMKTKTREEIDAAYKLVLRSKTMTSRGAGLGLIDIARKSGNRMDYELQKISEKEWYYSLHIKLPIPDSEESVLADESQSDLIIKNLIKQYEHNENTFLYSGDFSNTFLKNLLNMMAEQYKNDKAAITSIFKYALIELNQNINIHASSFENGKIPALLTIEWLKDAMLLSTSNFISEENAKKISTQINSFKQASLESLTKSIEERMNDSGTFGGLGLLDIARLNWPRPIEYAIDHNEMDGKSINLKIEFDYGRRTI